MNERGDMGWFGKVFWMLLFVMAAGAVTAADKPAEELRFGSVAMDIPPVMYRRLSPLTEYLSTELGRPVRLQLSPDMPSAIEALASGKVDFAYLTPVAYLRAHETGNAQLVAKTVTEGRGSFQLMIVVREDSPLQTVADLKGARFAFGDQAALLQRAVVVGAGMPLEDLGEYRFLGHYDNIVRGVLSGDFDAGILKDTMAFKWQGNGIRILYSSPHLPPYNIAARGSMDAATLARLKAAFLGLDGQQASQTEVIKALDKKYDGFAAVDDSDYDVVRRLVAPFKGEN